jgi:Protein of unknown function (DUF3500)
LTIGHLVDARGKAKSAEAMSKAASSFLSLLNAEQKAKATFALTDAERMNWHFVPMDRKGLTLKDMNDAQKAAAMELLKSSLSQRGNFKATSIISLEPVLQVIEGSTRRFPRDPGLYYISIFGDPSKGDWGWRFEGHHLSHNFTVVKGKAVIEAPAFYGTNPAEVFADVPQKGMRVLGAEEDLGRALITALDEKQRKVAIYDAKAPGDMLTFDHKEAKPQDKVGITASQLNGKQFAMLEKLVEEYVSNVPDDVASARRAKFKSAKKEEIYFAWSGAIERTDKSYTLDTRDLAPGAARPNLTGKLQGHYYRIQTPTFLIEYNNTQNNSNHIHSVWRDFTGDWGRDLLAEHYQEFPHNQVASAEKKTK